MFIPEFPQNLSLLPPDIDFEDIRILKALIKANKAIGELKGRSMSLPDPMLLMSAVMTKESVESSSIEGIHTTVESALEGEAISESSLSPQNKEALRYKQAMNWGFKNVKTSSLSTRLILGIQQTLLPESNIGYRVQQNSIKNQPTNEVIYTPPVATEINSLMSNWENFANNHDDLIDPLVKIAICHYQFEAIHPFGDGNGRTGRILMVLHMVETGMLQHPVLYISGFLNRNRPKYYELLKRVTSEGAWIEYIEFMVNGFAEQANKTTDKLLQMIHLHETIEARIKAYNPKLNSRAIVDHLFSHVVTSPTRMATDLGIHQHTASKYLHDLEKAEVLSSRWIGKLHLFACTELFKMVV